MADTYQAVEVSAPGVLRVVERPIREPGVAAGARAWVDHSAVECARGAGLARPSTPGPGRANVPIALVSPTLSEPHSASF